MNTPARFALGGVVAAAIVVAVGFTVMNGGDVDDREPTIDARPTHNGVIAVVGDDTTSTQASAPMDSDIYLVRSDGRHLRQLTDTTESEFAPAFSPDGTRLAFLRGWFCDCRPGLSTSVVVVDAIEGTELFVSDVPQGFAYNIDWSPDGRSILTHWHAEGGGWSTSAVDLATAEWHDLAQNLAGRVAWSPDGQWLLATTTDLFAVPADALRRGPITDPAGVPGARTLTDDAAAESAGAWAPDGLSILYLSHGAAGTSVMTVDLESGEQRVLAADGFSPAWSPDGKRVSYMKVDGPRFSPDEDFDPEGGEVWIVDLDGGDARVIASSFTPARWSPDSTLLYLYGVRGMAIVDTVDPDRGVPLMPRAFRPAGSDLYWLSALEQYDGAYGHQGGADWQATH